MQMELMVLLINWLENREMNLDFPSGLIEIKGSLKVEKASQNEIQGDSRMRKRLGPSLLALKVAEGCDEPRNEGDILKQKKARISILP